MNIRNLKGVDLNNFEKVPGLVALSDWRPFTILIAVLDYKDIVVKNLIKNECSFWLNNTEYVLTDMPNYIIKFIKIPKRDEVNAYILGSTVRDSIAEILQSGGKDYMSLFSEIDESI